MTSAWLGEAFGGGLELRPDLDGIEALSSEREALWTRLDKATFLSVDEKLARRRGTGLQKPAMAADPGWPVRC